MSPTAMCVSWAHCSCEVRGIGRFAAAHAWDVSPEQSYEPGPSAPQTYGLPIWARANFTAALPLGLASRLMSLSAPELSQEDWAAACACFSSSRRRVRSSFSSRASSFSASSIRALISFFARACSTRPASSLSQLTCASSVYSSKSAWARVRSASTESVACWLWRSWLRPSRKSRGSLLRTSWVPGGRPPLRYCSRAWAPAWFFSRAIFCRPSSMARPRSSSSAVCFVTCFSARLYASVAASAFR